MRVHSSGRRLGAVVGAAVLASVATAGAASAQTTLPVNYDFTAAAAATAALPAVPPPGSNDFSCKPTAAHPNPVVLVHGTFENMDDNWQAASPILANHGYCVFAFNYGGTVPDAPVGGLGEVKAAAGTLSAFVDRVLKATGAAKVDIVGHSQGGMMPRYYINSLGGAAKVDKLVALAPTNYGTTLDGITNLAQGIGQLGVANSLLSLPCESCVEQEVGSPFLAALNKQPTVPGVTYTVIETERDEVVSPYSNAFLPAAPNVTNITVQDQCPADASDHFELAYDPNALADMLNALDPAHSVSVACQAVLPLAGPVGPVPSF